MRKNIIGFVVLALLFVVVLHSWSSVASAGTPPGYNGSQYNGGSVTMAFTEDPDSGDDTAASRVYRNNTGEKICDFSVAPMPGATPTGGIKSVGVETWNGSGSSSSEGGSFHYDDNNDGDVNDTGEGNTTDDDGVYGSSGHSISSGSTQCIKAGHYFKITVSKADGASVNMAWNATSDNPTDGVGGGAIAAVDVSPKGTAVLVMVNNNFGIKVVHQGAVNVDPNSVTSIHLTPPSGVAIQDVWSDNHPGSFNSMTNVFTFSTAVPAGQFYSFEWEFDDFSLGLPETMFEWESN